MRKQARTLSLFRAGGGSRWVWMTDYPTVQKQPRSSEMGKGKGIKPRSLNGALLFYELWFSPTIAIFCSIGK